MASISNNQTLRLKKMVINGRNQTVYHPKVYRAKELPQFLVDENAEYIEVVDKPVTTTDTATVTLQGDGVQVKTINNVVTKPKESAPEAQTIEVKAPEEKMKVSRTRRKSAE